MFEPRSPAGRTFWLAAAGVLLLLGAALVAWGQPLHDLLTEQASIRAWVRSFGPWAPAAIVLLHMAQVVLAPVPGQAIGAASGYLYGPWLGTLYSMAGVVGGSVLLLALTRLFGRPLAARLLRPGTLARLDDLARRGGLPFFFLIWVLPFLPDDLACIAAGLTPIPARKLLAVLFLGRLPGVSISVWLGANAARISQPVWVVLLLLMALAGLALWHWGDRIQAALLRLISRLTGR